MQIISRGVVFKGEKDSAKQSCAFPNICVLPSGRWICAWRAAPFKAATTGQQVLLSWSDNQGKSWSEPIAPFTPLSVNGKLGTFRGVGLTSLGGNRVLKTRENTRVLAALCWVDHSDPSLPFFNEETEGLLDSRIFLARSDDGGVTWSKPEIVDTTPFNIPTPITEPVLLLPDERWACQFELNKTYYDTAVWRHSSVMLFSSDHGTTWPEHTIISHDPENRIFYWDQRPALLVDGTLLDLFWTYDNHQATYLNIHARQSKDSGRTWSEIWNTGVPGQPAPPVSLKDGRIAMVYVDRTSAPVIKVRVSQDLGQTWPVETENLIYQKETVSQTQRKKRMQDAWQEMGKFSVGLPNTASLPDGGFLVVYYAGPETDCTDIQWTRLEP